ncbi:Molybdenum cofactor biosynthesis protein A (plasmid) [Halomicrobium sp. LC1Hm]|nr:Molybdenum cofactor biosynthesis protein A [Halomicrobium sp. LC1Hm]
MPELAGHPEWAIDIDRVHGWLEDRADCVETREMHDRRRYHVQSPDSESTGVVEIVDPIENPQFCANCHRIRVTHDGRLRGCLNRRDDHESIRGMSRAEIREAFVETVSNRVPYYGEYLVEEDGDWVRNERYVETTAAIGSQIDTIGRHCFENLEQRDRELRTDRRRRYQTRQRHPFVLSE